MRNHRVRGDRFASGLESLLPGITALTVVGVLNRAPTIVTTHGRGRHGGWFDDGVSGGGD
ncbi:MAG: hypothetical protein U5N53_20965 [Mycobacterium sp.]|nr:hypothetical protein [Mycobacterium sp.]